MQPQAIAHVPVTAAEARPAAGWRRILGTAAGMVLGLVLLVAAWTKALDPLAFAREIESQGLSSAAAAPAMALFAIGLEVGIGVALLLGLRRLWVLLPAAGLVALFLFLTGRAYWLDLRGALPADAGCGCFGNLVQRTPAEAFWQDLAMLVPALLLAFVGRERGGRTFPPLRTAAVALLTLGAVGFAWKAPDLPVDDLATRLKPGVELSTLCAGRDEARTCLDAVVPDLTAGEHLVVLADLDDPGFQEAVADLNALVAGPEAPSLVVLSEATGEEQRAFYWRFGPAFELREAPAALLKPLYRSLPRAFEVRDGRVTRTFRGLPPLDRATEDLAAAGPAPSRDR
jgi:uncharacterized membrane protein YphA (DoxX/SURF4 family)